MKSSRIGEKTTNTQGYEMEICDYISSREVFVRFIGYENFRVKCSYRDFNRGMVKNPFNPTIYGIGFFGVGEYSKKNNTKAYQYWQDMIRRCYSQEDKKSFIIYKGCIVCEEWHNFQNFARWFEENYYEIDGEVMCIDKDILVKGNKVYSPDTCVFVPKVINTLFVKHYSSRGKLPIGIYFRSDRGKYVANYSNGKYCEKLGSFDNIADAFNAYKNAKEKYIKRVANKYREYIPIKLYNAMIEYVVEITD